MDRIPLEIFHRIVSMIDDEENPLWRPDKDSSPSKTGEVEASQSISNAQVEPHTNSSGGQSSSLIGLTKNMQRRLQNRLAAVRKLRLLRTIHRVAANMPTRGKRENLHPVRRTTVNRLATLKSLRLCNKKLAMTTAEFVFEEVLLHFTEESHAKLEAISQHAYKKYVQVLQIIPKAISGPLLQKKDFGRWLSGERTLIDNPSILYARLNYAGLLTITESARISRKAINLHYKEYSSLHAEQQKLFATAESVLQAAIGSFPQLKRVESGLCWDWSRRRQDIPPNDFESSTGSRRLFTRQGISPRDGIIDIAWKAEACQTKFDMDQGAMVLRAVARGRIISGARIDAGPLFQDLSTMVMQIADPNEKAVVNTLMADTKHFNFYINLADLEAVEEKTSWGKVVSFLHGMEKLESLRFRSAYLDTEDRFDQAFGDSITWSHLTHLSISGIDSFDFGGFAALIQRHKASLRRLTLYDVEYDEDEYNLLADLRAGALDKIRIWKLGRTVADPGLPAMDLRRETHGWTDSGSPHVFSGGVWSPRLGSDLREELVAKLFPSFAHAQTGLLAEDNESINDVGSEM